MSDIELGVLMIASLILVGRGCYQLGRMQGFDEGIRTWRSRL